jgi:hypothetical protein
LYSSQIDDLQTRVREQENELSLSNDRDAVNVSCIAQLESRIASSNLVLENNAALILELKSSSEGSEEYIQGLESQLGKQEELAAIVTILEREILKGHQREVDQRSVSETLVQKFKVSFETRIHDIISFGNVPADVVDGLNELKEEVEMMDEIIPPIEEEEVARSMSVEGSDIVFSHSPDDEGDVLDVDQVEYQSTLYLEEIDQLKTQVSSLHAIIGSIPAKESVSTNTDESLNPTESISTNTDESLVLTESVFTNTDDSLISTESISTNTDESLVLTESVFTNTDESLVLTESVFTNTDESLIPTESVFTNTDESLIPSESISTNTDESLIPTLELALDESRSRNSDLELKVVNLESIIDTSRVNTKKIEDKLDGFNNERSDLFTKLSLLQVQADSHKSQTNARDTKIEMLKRKINEKDVSLVELMNESHNVHARSYSSLVSSSASSVGTYTDLLEYSECGTITDGDETVLSVDTGTITDGDETVMSVDAETDPHVDKVVSVDAETFTKVVEKTVLCDAETSTERIESVEAGVVTEEVVSVDAGTDVKPVTNEVETLTDDLYSFVESGTNTDGVSSVVESGTNTDGVSSVVESGTNTDGVSSVVESGTNTVALLVAESGTNTDEEHVDRSIALVKEQEDDLLERIALLKDSFGSERSVYTSEIETLSGNIKTLEDVNRELKFTNSELETSISKIKESGRDESLVANLSNKIVSIQARNKELDSYNSDLKDKLLTIQAETRSRPQLNESVLSMWKKLAASEKIHKEQQSLISRLEQQLSDQESNLTDSKRMVEKADVYRERVTILESEVVRVKKLLSGANKANEAIEIHGEKFAFLHRRIKELEGQSGGDTREITASRSLPESSDKDVDELKSLVEEYEGKIKVLEDRVEVDSDMVSDRDALSDSVKEMSLRIVSIEKERDSHLASLEESKTSGESYRISTESELSTLRSDVKSRTEEVDSIKAQFASVSKAADDQSSVVSKLKNQIDEQDSSFIKVLNENMLHVEQISLLQSRVAESLKEDDEATSSRSLPADNNEEVKAKGINSEYLTTL